MMLRENKIVLLGAGNVATQMGIALQERGFPIVQVYSRTLTAAETLGKKLQAAYTDNLKAIFLDAAIYIFAVKDSALPEIIKELPPASGFWIHTSGSIPLDVFSDYSDRRGALYPLQTFSKNRNISFRNIPLLIEANRPEDEDLLEAIAFTLSNRVIRLSSEKRKYIHLAAVFTCNFTNHLYALGAKILEEQTLEWDLLLPLIQETASKAMSMHPRSAQTGPAVRYDENIMNKHLEMLKEKPYLQELYRLLSNGIYFSETND
jgi:predicted short-subunit dehydrogenase-like oxidoreductase (DUF2520 family)